MHAVDKSFKGMDLSTVFYVLDTFFIPYGIAHSN